MTRSVFTPGPWRAEKSYGDDYRIVYNDTGNWLADVYSDGEGAVAEADARLISSAPELLAAANLALSIAESWIHDQLDGTSSLDSELANLAPVRDAIAKATEVRS